jgi:ketosteroid isomerase-like protein
MATAFFDSAAPDVEFDVSSSPGPLAGVYRGQADVREFFRKWIGSWEDYELEVQELIDAGDSVVMVGWERGRGKGSGIRVENRLFTVWTFRNGKAIRIKRFSERAEALEAVGLRE